jgi:hypothetical protein
MSDCCVEEGMLQALRALECTPIPAQQHFIGVRRGEECLPYLVLRRSIQQGLRTSHAVEQFDQISVSAYFSVDKASQAVSFRNLLQQWAYSSGCLNLGNCGCFCVRSIQPSQVSYGESSISVTISMIGRFAATVQLS